MTSPPLVYCAIYTRVSARDGGEPACSSCTRQREACMQFIYQHRHFGWMPLTLPFDDNGRSGATLERPALNRLLDAIARGSVQRVVVHRFDRLTRSVRDFANLQDLLRRHGVGLSVVQGQFAETSSAIVQFQINMLATFAQFEREMIAERVREGRAAKRARGLRVAGPPPFGYSVDRRTKRLIVHHTEAEVVRSMFIKAQEGRTPSQLAAEANSSGTKNGRGQVGKWSAKTVLRILRNSTYAGLLCGGSRGIHTPLVAEGMFERVKAVIGERRTREPTKRPRPVVDPFLLRGLLACPKCGERMTTSSTGKVEGDGRRYYGCRRSNPCVGTQLPAQAIESFVVSLLAKPPATLAPDARTALIELARIWDLFWPANRKRALDSLVREIRADVAKGSIDLVVDGEAAAEWVRDLAS